MPLRPAAHSVAVVTLGCARNEIDSEELVGRLVGEGWQLVAEPNAADAVLVNTCGFIEAAKKDSIDAVLEVADGVAEAGGKVVAVGCLAERYGATLASSLPEADAVLSFDDYRSIGTRLADIVAGRTVPAHAPRDRRRLLSLSPVARPGTAPGAGVDPFRGPAYAASPPRFRLDGGPVAPLRLASGCDRRCAFCAIPSFRGSFVSRPPAELLAEARWLADSGVRELVLVSENSTSYGKDLGDIRLLEALLPELAAVPGILRIRVSYLQPAEMRPSLIAVLTGTPGVAPYFDLSFQHASAGVLRRMRRFGGTERFLALIADIRERVPDAGIRSNVIVGFPGERRTDVAELERFLGAARLDAVGIFGYSDEDGTEGAGLPGKVAAKTIARRLDALSRLAEELTTQRAEDRVGEVFDVLVETILPGGEVEGRAPHQAPEIDGTTTVRCRLDPAPVVGDLVLARVTAAAGVDLLAEQVPRRSEPVDSQRVTAAQMAR
ncbi:MAG: 30S ribosomal protein S12 methylthiotransferase RimO [Frankiaceae bacterium]